MHIGIVGVDREESITAMAEYIGGLPEGSTIYTLEAGEFHKEVFLVCKELAMECKVMLADTTMHGIQANLKRDVELAKLVDKVVAFWDYHDPDIILIITMAKLYGKLVHVNPHEDGGIISDSRLKVEDFEDDRLTDRTDNRQSPNVDCGICGYDDDSEEEGKVPRD